MNKFIDTLISILETLLFVLLIGFCVFTIYWLVSGVSESMDSINRLKANEPTEVTDSIICPYCGEEFYIYVKEN